MRLDGLVDATLAVVVGDLDVELEYLSRRLSIFELTQGQETHEREPRELKHQLPLPQQCSAGVLCDGGEEGGAGTACL